MEQDIKNISNKTLLDGIDVAHRERNAYSMIMDGLISLANLSYDIGDEDSGNKYMKDYEKYFNLSIASLNLLQKAYMEKSKRNL